MGTACTYLSRRERQEQMEYFRQLLSGWDVKSVGGTILISLCGLPIWYSETFGVSQRLLCVFFLAFMADWVLGLAQAIRTRWATPFKFHKIFYKVIAYAAVLLVCGGAKVVIDEVGHGWSGAYWLGSSICIFAIGYLTMTDLVSCLKNVERLGVELPYPVPQLIRAVYKRMRYVADKQIHSLENPREEEPPEDGDI